MNDNPTDADEKLYNALTQLFMAGTVDDSLQEAVAEARTAIMQWHQQGLEAAELRTRLQSYQTTATVLKHVINANGKFIGDSKAAAKHWKRQTDEMVVAVQAALKEMEQVKS